MPNGQCSLHKAGTGTTDQENLVMRFAITGAVTGAVPRQRGWGRHTIRTWNTNVIAVFFQAMRGKQPHRAIECHSWRLI
jgi:hypothetical protein